MFRRPKGLDDARAMFDRPEDAERLMRLFEAFDRGGEGGEGLRLALSARLLTPNGEKRVRLGRDCVIRGVIRCEGDGRAELGERVYLGDGAIVSARASVQIGDGTLIAHGTQVFDNDTHPLDAAEREDHFRAIIKLGKWRDFRIAAAPVRIGRRCWLGFNAAVMKGVELGDDAIVAAGAIVTRSAPAGAVLAGNPARPTRGSAGGDAPRGGLSGLFRRR